MMPENNTPREDALTPEEALAAFETVEKPQNAAPKKRLSNNTRTLIVVTAVVAVLAILLAVLLPLLNDNTGGSSVVSGDEQTESVFPLYDRTKDDTKQAIVQSVAIQNAKDTYTIDYNSGDKVYRLRDYSDFSLDSVTDDLIEACTVLNAYEEIKKEAPLADFGLAKPAVKVTVTYHDGSQTELHLGNTSPDENGVYARTADSDTVYIINTDTADLFRQTKGQYVERTLIASPTVKDDDANGGVVLKELTLKGGPSGQTLTLRQGEKSDGLEFTYATFVITSPYKRMVDETISETLEGFTYLRAAEAVVLKPTAADKTKYGFDKPYAVADITLAVQSVLESENSSSAADEDEDEQEFCYYNAIQSTVTVGNKDKDGNYYVMVEGSDAIYCVIPGLLSPIIERTYENTVSRLLFLKDISTIGKLTVMTDGKEHTFALQHDESKEDADDQLTVTYNSGKLGTADFRRLYSQMMSMDRYSGADTAPTGEPAHTIRMYLNDGSVFLSLDYHVQTASLYTVRTTDGELFTVKASSINNWLTQMHNYIAGKGVADL